MLPMEEHAILAAHCELVTYRAREVLSEFGRPVGHLHFPTSCVATLVQTAESGSRSAAAIVGNDGFVGVGALLGGGALPGRVEVQVSGACFRIPESVVSSQLARNTALRAVLLCYVQTLLVELTLGVACRCSHTSEQRLACRLLLIRERAGSSDLPLTQDAMAVLLGVRRETVNHAAMCLQNAGAIRYVRGRVRIVDRRALEGLACECYRLIRSEYDRLMRAPRGMG